MIHAPTRRGRERAARAMASENPTEYLSKRLLIGGVDYTDRLEACVIKCERREEEEDGSGGQVRPALALDATLGGRVEGLVGQTVELWRYIDGEPHIGFVGEVEEEDPGSEETPIQANTPGRWLAEINFMARTSFGGTASAAAYAICRRNSKYRGIKVPPLSIPFIRRGSRDYAANGKLAVALEDLRRETGLCVLDRADSTALGWVPPALASRSVEPAVWYEVGVHIDGNAFKAPKRRTGSYGDAWAHRTDARGNILTVARRPLERRGLIPPLGADFEISISDDDGSSAEEVSKKSGAQRVADAARLFSYRERDVSFPVFSDPRLERTDVIGLIVTATEGGTRVVRRYAMPVEAFEDDVVQNEVVRIGFATELSVERTPLPRPRIVVPRLSTDGMSGAFAGGYA